MRLTRVYVDAPLERPGARASRGQRGEPHGARAAARPGDAAHASSMARRGVRRPHRLRPRDARARRGRRRTRRSSASRPCAVTLAQGVSRGERMDLVMQKATELGVRAIVPLLTERSVVRLDAHQAAAQVQHWRAIAIAACEQCGRNRLPELAAPLVPGEFLRSGAQADSTRLLLSPTAGVRLARSRARDSAVTVLIGPEGGLAPAEQASAMARGYSGVRMGRACCAPRPRLSRRSRCCSASSGTSRRGARQLHAGDAGLVGDHLFEALEVRHQRRLVDHADLADAQARARRTRASYPAAPHPSSRAPAAGTPGSRGRSCRPPRGCRAHAG